MSKLILIFFDTSYEKKFLKVLILLSLTIICLHGSNPNFLYCFGKFFKKVPSLEPISRTFDDLVFF